MSEFDFFSDKTYRDTTDIAGFISKVLTPIVDHYRPGTINQPFSIVKLIRGLNSSSEVGLAYLSQTTAQRQTSYRLWSTYKSSLTNYFWQGYSGDQFVEDDPTEFVKEEYKEELTFSFTLPDRVVRYLYIDSPKLKKGRVDWASADIESSLILNRLAKQVYTELDCYSIYEVGSILHSLGLLSNPLTND